MLSSQQLFDRLDNRADRALRYLKLNCPYVEGLAG